MNKGRLAPIAYFATQFFFLACLVLSTRSMIEFSDSMYMIAYWVVVGITMAFYLFIHFKDPGYVPYDAIFFTDQEQVPEPGIIKKCSNLPKNQNLNIAEDGLSTKRQTKIEVSHVENSKSMNQQEISHSLAWLKPKTKQPLPPLTIVKNIELTIKEGGRQIETAPVPTHVRNNANFGIINCEPTEEDEEAYYYCDAQTNDVIREEEETHHEAQSVVDNNNHPEKQAPPENEKALDDIEEKNEESDGSQFNKRERILSQDTQSVANIGDSKTQTHSEIKDLKELKVMDITNDTEMKLGMEDKPSKRVSVDTQLPCSSSQREIANIINKGFTVRADQCKLEEKYLYSQENELSTVTCEPSVHREEGNVTKEPESTRKSMENINIEEQNKSPEILKEGEVPQKKINDDGALYIERRYCLICNIDQPLRSKHCNKCNKCVARYDHHCPWIGICVGEKNHVIFYWYLVFQLAQLVWSETELIRGTVSKNANDLVVFTVLRSLLALAIGCFCLFVFTLLAFQSYLACKNLTTWERLSWNKITYLGDWKKTWGSPFSKGIVQNLLFFCCKRKRELRRWKMPKFKRPLNNQTVLA